MLARLIALLSNDVTVLLFTFSIYEMCIMIAMSFVQAKTIQRDGIGTPAAAVGLEKTFDGHEEERCAYCGDARTRLGSQGDAEEIS
jgi:hypothetical protein